MRTRGRQTEGLEGVPGGPQRNGSRGLGYPCSAAEPEPGRHGQEGPRRLTPLRRARAVSLAANSRTTRAAECEVTLNPRHRA
ncbi:hypothetical protein SKAU_G00292840 [Synaphobranchus kaupii]|uniref:Uncharacterized protein n=1 Tax=Synaphobranchus kaupii TaxID=118154 RepID=A0A9Q1EU43_SYNKA|nr:hypothetical protein SKAU_G00292840 [Synaphobranchus kaupii]